MAGVKGRSGAKPKPAEQHRVYISARVDPATYTALKALRAKGDSLGRVLDRVVADYTARSAE